MHLRLNTDNDNYDRSRGEQIALNVDGEKANLSTPATYQSEVMDTQVRKNLIKMNEPLTENKSLICFTFKPLLRLFVRAYRTYFSCN